MPIREIAGTGTEYALVVFDEHGIERREPNGMLMSEAVLRQVADSAVPVTDVIVASHGWQGDVPAAIAQYDKWLGTMASLQPDQEAARRRQSGFMPLIVGLHWPSLPWGDEMIPTDSGSLLSAGDARPASIESQIDGYAAQIADTPTARAAIRTILDAAAQDPEATTLSPEVSAAYDSLFAESGLGSRDASGRPGADQDGFDPIAIIAEARADGGLAVATPGVLGIRDILQNAVLMPLRQLSFWRMKDRARQFGETGGHDLLHGLQMAAPQAHFHLMGHSFGCIVGSAAVAGLPGGPALPRPVDSLFLAQGALSLWSYAGDIPYAPATPGYFHRILQQGLVRGPIVTTRSSHDTAVGRFYPLGAGLRRQLVLGREYPAYGGIGTFGIRGFADAEDMAMQPATYGYDFRAGRVYNLEASNVIKYGGGAAGAHNDIAHPEVAHAFWEAMLAGRPMSLGGRGPVLGWRSGLLGGDDLDGVGEQKIVFSDVTFPVAPGVASPFDPDPAQLDEPQPLSTVPVSIPPEQQQQRQHRQGGPGSPGQQPPQQQQQQQQQRQERQQSQDWPGQQQQQQQQQRQGQERQQSQNWPGQQQQQQQEQRPRPQQHQPGQPPQQSSPELDERRWINAEFEDRAPGQPLTKGRWYTLAFDVDLAPRDTAVGTSTLLADTQLFSEGVDEIVLTVQLDSADFEISEPVRPLRLPRAGKSNTKARFEISPLHDGPWTLRATIHKDGNFIQQMTLTFEPGATQAAPAQVSAHGRLPSAVSMVQPRDVGLSTLPIAGGYDCTVWGPVASHARLPLETAFLANAVDTARQELMKVVMYRDAAGEHVFQTRIDIPPADRDGALRTMARAGALLFWKMFLGPGAGADSVAIGEFLRKMASNPGTFLKLQIVAEKTPVPWGLLYLGDASDEAKLSWDNFLGMRHVIEQIPLQSIPTVTDSAIPSDKPQLAVSVNVNSGIDAQMGADFVAQQQVFWAAETVSRKRMRVVARTTRAEVMQALKDGTSDDQILYFYCHAESNGLSARGGPGESSLVLTDARITLDELHLNAPATKQLCGNPLVFINACESAEMSPAFYDGFVPYFMAKGARGVIGTECKTPALFAMVWAKRFFERFLDGEPLGAAFLGLRREFLQNHGNPLGLLYAVHCDGDTQIQPALTATA